MADVAAERSAAGGGGAAAGEAAGGRGGAAAPPKKARRAVKPLTRAKLEDFQAAQENRGVCYSRILNVHLHVLPTT